MEEYESTLQVKLSSGFGAVAARVQMITLRLKGRVKPCLSDKSK